MTARDHAGGALASSLARAGVEDLFIDGSLRFSDSPVVLSPRDWAEMRGVAEQIAQAYDEVVAIVSREPELLDTFFELTPTQKIMWQLSAPHWHVFGRVDLFRTEGGWRTTEMNCDTPTGQAEVAAFSSLLAPSMHSRDPNRALEERFVRAVRSASTQGLGRAPRTVAILFPTDQTEDLSLIRLYRAWFSRAGMTVVLGSPYNVTANAAGETLVMGQACDVIFRHYKTDWWGERVGPLVDDEPFDDPVPLSRELLTLAQGEESGACVVINPFACVVPQNKRAMALMWEEIDRFSPAARRTIESHVPYTIRVESLHRAQLRAERDRFVLKSDYGAEGDEVCVGANTSEEDWRVLCDRLGAGRWVAQERFAPMLNRRGEEENLGVYVFAGQAAGVYARRSVGPTTRYAHSASVVLSEPAGDA